MKTNWQQAMIDEQEIHYVKMKSRNTLDSYMLKKKRKENM